MHFQHSAPLTLGVELELQLLSLRDFDLTRAATDLIESLNYDGQFGEIKLEITESMIEISTLAQQTISGIADNLTGLRNTLRKYCKLNNIAICGGGTHPFHRWAERRICPGDRFNELYQRYGYLAKQFTVFGQHIHIGCSNADDAIWLTQALATYVPAFIALSASSPFVDGVDSFFQSARLNAVSAFPLSGQCPALNNWEDFCNHFALLKSCGVARSIKDLYWDIRPKPEFGTVEIRVCDTPLSIEQATALAAFAQALCCWLLQTRPELHTEKSALVARHNKFQACRYGLEAQIADPVRHCQTSLRRDLLRLFDKIAPDAKLLGSFAWLEKLRTQVEQGTGDANWLRSRKEYHANLHDVARDMSARFIAPPRTKSESAK